MDFGLYRCEVRGETGLKSGGEMKRVLALAMMLVGISAFCFAAKQDGEKISEEELVRRTQEMNDATAVGDKTPWKMYFADDAIYFDEKGRKMDKAALVADVTGLPKGYSGSIRVVHPQSLMLGSTAILTYDLDETETIFGQSMKARYHGTDTWMFRGGGWQIVAGQMLRYYEDPATGRVDAARLDDYVGTYELTDGMRQTISRDGDKLYSKRTGRADFLLEPEVADLFFRPGVEGRLLFRRNDTGKVDALIDRRNNEDVVWKRL
jgi:Domain of unknown function (DUF4440)/Domain of unknown function (DUF3471)